MEAYANASPLSLSVSGEVPTAVLAWPALVTKVKVKFMKSLGAPETATTRFEGESSVFRRVAICISESDGPAWRAGS